MDRAAVHFQRDEDRQQAQVLEEVLCVEPSHVLAADQLAFCYHRGHGVVRDLARATELYEVARKVGNMIAAVSLGALCVEQGNFQKAIEIGEEMCRAGDLRGLLLMGSAYQTEGDFQKARESYEEARRGGLPEAATMLVRLHPYQQQQQQQQRKQKQKQKQNQKQKQKLQHGDVVKIHSLSSAVGLQLNGEIGQVISFDCFTGRYGLKVAGCNDLKAILAKNLTAIA